MRKQEKVILVNNSGLKKGVADKLKAHQEGLLHRAFSIFIFNEDGEMLLQKRSAGKYHFAGLWSNACCSHPGPGERTISAATRRLKEELGIESTLKKSGHILYKFFDKKSGLTEHEFDYIFRGKFNGGIPFNKKEVEAVKWISSAELKKEMQRFPEKFTPWFREAMKRIRMPSAQ